MSVSQSDVNYMRSQLSEQQRINGQLRRELGVVESGVMNARNELEQTNSYIQNTLDESHRKMNSSHDKIIAAYELQGEIEKLYIHFKNMELANKKIRACNNRKYYDFANYRTVRKMVQGIMDNLDVNMVSDRVIYKSIEKQHLQTPDFWLTCVLLSIMAWKNDDKELSDRAMAKAVSLDKKHSTVFFMLFNLRMGREEAALKWFLSYQECELKGSDHRVFLMLFSLVSKTLQDNVEEHIRDNIMSFIVRVIELCAASEGFSQEDIINIICSYLDRMQPSDQLEYDLLRKCCKEFDSLTDVMMRAKNNINILDFILQTVNVSIEQKNDFLKGYIDELLEEANDTEKAVYDEISYNELIIKCEGEKERADELYERERKRRESDLNLVSEMIRWIYDKEQRQDVNGQIRLNMFTLTKHLQEMAIDRHVEDYRSREKTTLPVSFNDYTTQMDFLDETKELRKAEDYYQTVKGEKLAKIKDLPAYLGFAAAAAAGIGAFFTGFWLFAVSVAGIAFGIFTLLSNRSSRKLYEIECSNSIGNANEMIHKLFAEFGRYRAELKEYDDFYTRIQNELIRI